MPPSRGRRKRPFAGQGARRGSCPKCGVQELRRYPVNSEGAGDQRAGCVSREATLYCALHHAAAA